MRTIVPSEKPDLAENPEDLEKKENIVGKKLLSGPHAKRKEDNGILASKNLLLGNKLEDDICSSSSLCLVTKKQHRTERSEKTTVKKTS